MQLKCKGKLFECSVCEKLFNNYSVMVVHKRIHFSERPYKCVECSDQFNCKSGLKTHYKVHNQQNENVYASHVVDANLPSCLGNKEQTTHKGIEVQITYNGKFYSFHKINKK